MVALEQTQPSKPSFAKHARKFVGGDGLVKGWISMVWRRGCGRSVAMISVKRGSNAFISIPTFLIYLVEGHADFGEAAWNLIETAEGKWRANLHQ